MKNLTVVCGVKQEERLLQVENQTQCCRLPFTILTVKLKFLKSRLYTHNRNILLLKNI